MSQLLNTFIELAEEYNGELSVNNDKVNLVDQSKAIRSTYRLIIPYKNVKFKVQYIMGTQHLAEFHLIMPWSLDELKFEISTRSNFMSLFFPNKDRLTIDSKDESLVSFLRANNHFIEMRELIRTTRFEPFIYGENKKDDFIVRTEYHLRFPKRTIELRPHINFYKDLIDYLLRK